MCFWTKKALAGIKQMQNYAFRWHSTE